MQKTDKFIHNEMAVQSTEIRDTYLLTAEMFSRQISGLSAHGSHSAYNRTPAGTTGPIYSLSLYIYIQWGKKVFSQPPIVHVLPLKTIERGL